MIVTIGSIRGSPGATSWSLLLASAWPREFAERRVVLEADPAGGVLGARYGLGVEPGAVRLVTAVRRNGATTVDLGGIARELGGDLSVVPGPESGEQARAVWAEGASAVSARLAHDQTGWFVDAGRLDDSNPCMAFADSSSLVVVVAGPRHEDLVQLPSRLSTLRRRCDTVGVIVSGRCAFAAQEIADFCQSDRAWVVPARDDLVGEVGRLLGGSRARRSWLWRYGLDVAADAYALVSSKASSVSEATA